MKFDLKMKKNNLLLLTKYIIERTKETCFLTFNQFTHKNIMDLFRTGVSITE